jgi:16S rRNA (adenine1518-N6/adenine1519-N6)-dimethyltransferase
VERTGPRAEPFPDARVLLGRYGLAAKKRFGQNFLISERVFRAIVDATVAGDDDWIVEIGAGLGTLTARLAERVPEGKVIALERDPDMIAVLRGELGGVDNVEIEGCDALRYDLGMAARWRGAPVAVCGNLPYHIAAPLLFRILDARAGVRCAVVMIQKEMADRIVASPGTKAYGALGVMIRTYADVTTVAKVTAGSFVPAPKVDSTVLRLVPLAGGAPRVPIADPAHYSRVVHAAFGQRRKTLRNALKAIWEDVEIDAALAASEIDGGRRGETLDITEHGRLAAALPVRAMAGSSA